MTAMLSSPRSRVLAAVAALALPLVQAALVVGLAAGARNAVPESMGVLAVAGIAIAGVFAVVAFFVLIAELFWDAVFSG